MTLREILEQEGYNLTLGVSVYADTKRRLDYNTWVDFGLDSHILEEDIISIDVIPEEEREEWEDAIEVLIRENLRRKFRFKYLPDNPEVIPEDGWGHSGYTDGKFTEYDGYEVIARCEAEAWEDFLDYSGEFGQPDARDYTCIDVTEE